MSGSNRIIGPHMCDGRAADQLLHRLVSTILSQYFFFLFFYCSYPTLDMALS